MLPSRELVSSIDIGEGKVEARIVVSVASVLRGLKKSRLTDAGLRHRDDDPLIHAARWMQYPALVSGTTGGEIAYFDAGGKRVETIDAANISFEQFLALPEKLAVDWLDSVFDMNPSWIFTPEVVPGSEEGKG